MRFLLLNQTFHPDVMATGQYLTEVAVALVREGHAVTVVTSSRAYDEPARRFPSRESWKGVDIRRVGSTAFGKGAKWRRTADFASYIFLCVLRLIFLKRHDVVVALTSPPLISFIGACLARVRRSQFVYWVMDMNPDEALAAGWLRPRSLAARVLEWMSRFSFRQADTIIALDRFMADRIKAKGIPAEMIVVLPPWSHDSEVRFDPAGRDAFRKAHGLEGKFVVMYSGNHSPCHPLDTLLAAAGQMRDEGDIVFLFVGGGSEWRKISASVSQCFSPENATETLSSPDTQVPGLRSPHSLQVSGLIPQHSNILCLPYQPLEHLSASLSAADLHVVVMGDPFVGLVHPCKIYNILRVGAPVLYIGPKPSHLTELLQRLDAGYFFRAVPHGDPAQVVRAIRDLRAAPPHSRHILQLLESAFSERTLLPRLLRTLKR